MSTEVPDIPPGTIAVISADDLARYHVFTFSLAALQAKVPPGTRTVWCKGPSVVDNLNGAVATMDADSAWLLILGDDHEFDDDLAVRLLARMYRDDLDIVVPLCLMRAYPFLPVAYGERVDRGFVPLDLDAAFEKGPLVEVAAAGNAGMVIRKRVIAAMGDPLFKMGAVETGENEITTGLAEDLRFCEDARSYGFKVWLDMSTRIGHVTTAVVWPARHDEQMGVKLAFGKQETMFLPRDMLMPPER